MSLHIQLKEDAEWLKEHEHFMSEVREGYDAIVGDVEDAADQAKELETLVKQAFELLSSEWEPDDIDRAKFLRRLERAIP